jgi:hypothetical protein
VLFQTAIFFQVHDFMELHDLLGNLVHAEERPAYAHFSLSEGPESHFMRHHQVVADLQLQFRQQLQLFLRRWHDFVELVIQHAPDAIVLQI